MHDCRSPRAADLICLSHLRWNFVFQRPQHLLTRFAAERRVFYVEEPLTAPGTDPFLRLERSGALTVATPYLPADCTGRAADELQRWLVDDLIAGERIGPYVLWYYTPMAVAFTDHLLAEAIVYDCMDELSGFAHAPASLKDREAELLRRATVVFTGGTSLYEAKRGAHPNVHLFPSSVDVDHFAAARRPQPEPGDQRAVERPRLGFFGVIDERLDTGLLAGVAAARPDWHVVMIGPTAKVDPATLPRAANIHYLGPKRYDELPQYVAGWDVALLPFARNEATRYISPTKTPEYLAAGKPVVSTSIHDVVRPYGERGLVRIADTVDQFVAACEAALAEDAAPRMRAADAFLRQTSWDGTWTQMRHIVDTAVRDTVPARGADAAQAG